MALFKFLFKVCTNFLYRDVLAWVEVNYITDCAFILGSPTLSCLQGVRRNMSVWEFDIKLMPNASTGYDTFIEL